MDFVSNINISNLWKKPPPQLDKWELGEQLADRTSAEF